MKMIMKKETSDNLLREKMDAFNEVDAMNTRNYQLVWDRIEDKLHPKNKRKAIRFYLAAAAMLLIILAGFIIQYPRENKPPAHFSIQYLPIEKTPQVLPSNLAADSFAHSIKPGQSKLILNNSKKKISIPVQENQHIGVSYKNYEAISSIAKPTEEVIKTNLAEPPVAIIRNVNSIETVASPKKPILKVLHINEIYNANAIKPTETIKEPNVNWLFTTNNINPEIQEADNNYLPVTRKKNIFSIPLQK